MNKLLYSEMNNELIIKWHLFKSCIQNLNIIQNEENVFTKKISRLLSFL